MVEPADGGALKAADGSDLRRFQDLLSIHPGEIQARQSDLISAGTFPVDHLVTTCRSRTTTRCCCPAAPSTPTDYGSTLMRSVLVKAFVATGQPVAAICHGPWTLIETDVVRGHRFTSWPSLWTDLRLAGAEAVDEELVIDGQFTSSRSPADLPAFCPAIVAQFAKASVPG